MKCHSEVFFFAMLAFAVAYISMPVPGHADTELKQLEGNTQTEEEESSPEYIEQYDEWDKANKEPDLLKRGAMLIEFMDKYPESTLLPNIEASYRNTLIECDNDGKYQELESLAEQWLKIKPKDLPVLAYVVKAAEKLGHDEKRIQYLIKIYDIQPTAGYAYAIAQSYDKIKNKAKYLEWVEKAFTYPEFESNFLLRYSIVKYYTDAKEFAKAAQYAQLTLKAADLVKDPSSETKAQLHQVRHACYHLIGLNLMEGKKYAEAIHAFKQALKAEKYWEGYYSIAQCLRHLNNVDDALVYLAKADLQGSTAAVKAKEELEMIYKKIHGGNLTGINKIYRKAEKLPD